ncbi:hypothetical protein LCGC14_2342830, partial [marine sediment metagenome]
LYATYKVGSYTSGTHLLGGGVPVSDSSVGTVVWAQTTGALTDDDDYSTAAHADGVRVSGGVTDDTVRLFVGGSPVGDDKAFDSTFTSGVRTYGGSSELWGLTPSVAQVNASDFGIGFSILGNAGTSEYLYVSNFGFNVPTGAIIDGIEVYMDREATESSTIKDDGFYLRKTSGQVGNNKADTVNYWDTIDNGVYNIYGDPTDLWGTTWTAAEINSANFGIDISVKWFTQTNYIYARIDHIKIKVYYTAPILPHRGNAIVRPDGDVSTQWDASTQADHYTLINDIITEPFAPDINSGYLLTLSSSGGTNIIDEFTMGTLYIDNGFITQIQIKVYGNETDIDSTVDVYCGSWLGAQQLDMGSTPEWYTYTWDVSGLGLSQTDLDGMKIKFDSVVPEKPYFYDYVQYGDILDYALGNHYEFVVTGQVNPSLLTTYESNNGVANVFISKEGNFELGITSDGYLQLYINTNGVETTVQYGTINAIPTNQWTFVAVRYIDGDVDVFIGADWYYSAVDGVLEPWDGGGTLVSGGDFVIGAELSTYSCFTGKLDEISVFNRGLPN